MEETRMRPFLLAAGLALLMTSATPGCADPGAAGEVLSGPAKLGEGATLVPVRPPREAGGTLVISGLAWDSPPGVIYEVLLQSSGGRRAPVGTISFYNETAPGGGNGERRFDASAAIQALGGDVAGLVFLPTSGVDGGPPAKANPLSHLRFSSVTLVR
jgi:hypothetical protein